MAVWQWWQRVQCSGGDREWGGGGRRWCAGAKKMTVTIGGEMTAGREHGREWEGEGEGSGKGARVQIQWQGCRWWQQGRRWQQQGCRWQRQGRRWRRQQGCRAVADSKLAGAEGVGVRAWRASARKIGARGRERAVAQRAGAMAQGVEEMAAQRAVQA